MTIAAWPLAHRSQLVHAYKPGEHSTSEGPFRTLRKHAWATAGVRVTPRPGNILAGQLTIFSSLNMESARLARHGYKDEAVRVAAAASELEAGREFELLREILAELPASAVRSVVDGTVPEGSPVRLMNALKTVAVMTEEIRDREVSRVECAEVIAGRVKEIHDSYVILVLMNGPEALVPRWMARAARRATVGAFLVLVTDRLDGASAVIEALPAIDVDSDTRATAFSPFGRADARALDVTADDERMLAGEPAPVRVLVPVTIH